MKETESWIVTQIKRSTWPFLDSKPVKLYLGSRRRFLLLLLSASFLLAITYRFSAFCLSIKIGIALKTDKTQQQNQNNVK